MLSRLGELVQEHWLRILVIGIALLGILLGYFVGGSR